ncbi:DNA repair protein [Vibrio porteresiae]|uniref:DNA repair protein n=1 Tax=Vibrio porteresiae DSM 19223 TaxID=1123496 RepID=A0ABZ0Q9K7_9VIBR|nr:DNA repair protein [Vibrio porteresiae]WPC72256.1 DNA repair protein [Vibrio porteresiae DSM 19223]
MNQLRKALVASALMTLIGCQSTPKEGQQAAQTNQELQQANAEFAKIQTMQAEWTKTLDTVADLKIYSPSDYDALLKAWSDAGELYKVMEKNPNVTTEDRSFFSSQSYAQAYQDKMTVVDTQHKKLLAYKGKADVLLADSIAQMAYLEKIYANRHFPTEFRSLTTSYNKLFAYVKNDELEDAQDKQIAFLDQGKKLEIKISLKLYISPLEQEKYVLQREGFNSVAPMAFSAAQSEIQLASNVVSSNPRDKVAIEAAVAKARFELQHVKQVAHQVKLLAAVEDDKYESYVLDIENQLLAISKTIDGSDFRDVVLREQAEKILQQVKALRNTNKVDELSQQLSAEKADALKLKSENQQLNGELSQVKTLNQSYQNQIDQQAKLIENLEKQLQPKAPAVVAPLAPVTPAATTPQAVAQPVVNTDSSPATDSVATPSEANVPVVPAPATSAPVVTEASTAASEAVTAN